MDVRSQFHAPAAVRGLGTRWMGGCVGIRVGLDAVAKKKIQ
jgi:hypothetical protein